MYKIDYNSIDWKEFFYYDETSPSCLRWNKNIYAGRTGNSLIKKKDDAAGSLVLNADGSPKCWDVRLNYRSYKVHRIVWCLINPIIDNGLVVDHFDQNPSNNNISNLRLIPKKSNHRNSRKRLDNTSGFTGVNWQTMNNGKHLYAVASVEYNAIKYSKRFAVHQYGKEEAFRLACLWRIEIVSELNSRGADFTEQHGK